MEVRDASTVVLLRDRPGGRTDARAGIQVWMLTRVRQMAFAAGMSVFPGGRAEDADAGLPFAAGDAVTAAAARFGCDPAQARRLLGAAARETFEETGVLLSRPAADLSAAQRDAEAGRIAFGDLLRGHGLVIDAAALRPWARWVTPPGGSRRYDTRFFVAALPAGADAHEGSSESSVAGWVGPADAVDQAERGERSLLPPTFATLAALGPFDRVADVLAAADARPLGPISPVIRHEGERLVAELPGGERLPLPPGVFA